MPLRETIANNAVEACIAAGMTSSSGCTFERGALFQQVQHVKFVGLDYAIDGNTLIISGRVAPKRLLSLAAIKKHPILTQPRTLFPVDFFDPAFGQVRTRNDYIARWIMMTTPNLWSTWVTATQVLLADVRAGQSKKPLVSGNDVAPLVRAKFFAPTARGEPYQITNNFTSYYMKLYKVMYPNDAALIATKTGTLDPRIDPWVQNGDLLVPK